MPSGVQPDANPLQALWISPVQQSCFGMMVAAIASEAIPERIERVDPIYIVTGAPFEILSSTGRYNVMDTGREFTPVH